MRQTREPATRDVQLFPAMKLFPNFTGSGKPLAADLNYENIGEKPKAEAKSTTRKNEDAVVTLHQISSVMLFVCELSVPGENFFSPKTSRNEADTQLQIR